MALEITDGNFQELVLNSDKLAVIDFWAVWCGPCKAIAPTIEELSIEYKDSVVIGKLDVDSNPDTSVKYGVRSIPTILFVKNGKVVDTVVGAAGKKVLEDKIKAFI